MLYSSLNSSVQIDRKYNLKQFTKWLVTLQRKNRKYLAALRVFIIQSKNQWKTVRQIKRHG